jgi:hypothetical protein
MTPRSYATAAVDVTAWAGPSLGRFHKQTYQLPLGIDHIGLIAPGWFLGRPDRLVRRGVSQSLRQHADALLPDLFDPCTNVCCPHEPECATCHQVKLSF